MPLKLNHVEYGQSGPVLVILHGLLGSSRNWASIAKALEERFHVFALDLRNHGSSPHSGPFTYDDLMGDVVEWLQQADVGPVTLVGHSLGGKTAMVTACRHRELVERLVVVDASPCPAPPRWEAEFAAMKAIPVDTLKDRREAEAQLESAGIDDWAFRKFLTSNLERCDSGGFQWKVNLDALEASLPEVFRAPLPEDAKFDGPAVLIRGGESRFVPEGDLTAFRRHFPASRVETIPGAGHNVHADEPRAFLNALRGFLVA